MVAGGVSTRTVKGVFLWLQRLEDGPCFVGGHERRWSAMTDRLRAHRVVNDGALGGETLAVLVLAAISPGRGWLPWCAIHRRQGVA